METASQVASVHGHYLQLQQACVTGTLIYSVRSQFPSALVYNATLATEGGISSILYHATPVGGRAPIDSAQRALWGQARYVKIIVTLQIRWRPNRSCWLN